MNGKEMKKMNDKELKKLNTIKKLIESKTTIKEAINTLNISFISFNELFTFTVISTCFIF